MGVWGLEVRGGGASTLAREQVPQSVVVVLVEGRVDERVEERVGVAQPEEDALPDGRDVTGAEGHDELRDEEGDPAQDEDPDEDAHHEGRLLLLLLAPRVAVCLECNGGVADVEDHLGLPGGLLHLSITPSACQEIIPPNCQSRNITRDVHWYKRTNLSGTGNLASEKHFNEHSWHRPHF